jgi:asparagine synthase (glutamine-hydrolysing)
LPDDLLLLTDKMTMATSLECRVPLLDHELVELCAAMPADVRMRGGELKHVMKRALSGVLPPAILNRRKRGFGTPMGAWLKRDLAPVLASVLAPAALERRGLLRAEPVQRLIADHRANRVDGTDRLQGPQAVRAHRVDGTDRLLALLALELWCRITLDGCTPDALADELRASLPPARLAA